MESEEPVENEKRVLVVDDMRTMRMLVPAYLVGRNYSFDFAGTGREGLELAQKSTPDLIISDVHMPDMTGSELCLAVRKVGRLHRVPFILMTGTATVSEARRLMIQCGADAILAKPLDPVQLTEVVDRVMAGGRVTIPP